MSVALAACLISAIGPSTAVEATRPTAKCYDVDADFTSELATEGCTSPLGLCAAGAIKHDPIIKGPMFVTINDAAASAGMPASEPASILSVSGERILRPRRGGTLSAHVVGIAVVGRLRCSDDVRRAESHHRRHGTFRGRDRHAARGRPGDKSDDVRG